MTFVWKDPRKASFGASYPSHHELPAALSPCLVHRFATRDISSISSPSITHLKNSCPTIQWTAVKFIFDLETMVSFSTRSQSAASGHLPLYQHPCWRLPSLKLGMMLAPILFPCMLRKTLLAGGFAASRAHSVLKVSSGLRKTSLCMRADEELGYIKFLSMISGIEQSTRKFTNTL